MKQGDAGAASLLIDDEQAVEGPAGPIPARRRHSIRRTATIDMLWPDGRGGRMQLRGRARDLLTGEADAPPRVVGSASMEASVRERVIESITTDPSPAGIPKLVGERGGGHLRGVLAALVPDERKSESPLYLLLDDISGTSLIGGVVWTRWPEERRKLPTGGGPNMEGVCIGFRPGSSALTEISDWSGPPRVRPVADLLDPSDPHAWHELPAMPPMAARRARFIDITVEGETVHIEGGFQDSAGDPEHGRIGIHEYRIHAEADLASGRLTRLTPVPHILPFRECPSAVATSQTLVGAPVADLRDVVLERLAATQGCTHLNDALRALAEVPALVEALRKDAPSHSAGSSPLHSGSTQGQPA